MDHKPNAQKDHGPNPEHGEKPSSRLVPYLIGGVLLLLVLFFLIGYLPRNAQRKELEAFTAKETLPSVVTMKVTAENKESELILPSSIEAIRVTPIWARVNGYLQDFKVDIGDRVKKGQLLAVIDTPEIDQQVDQAKADLASAFSNRELARISFQRWKDLYQYNPEAISKQEVDEREAADKSSLSAVESSKANLERLLKTQQFKYILAPFDGVITERDIDMGSLITQGSNGNPQQLFKIAKTDVLRVFVNVPQKYFRSIYDGLQAQVTIREFPNQEFKGVVVRNAKALDPIARTLRTEVHIDNAEGKLIPGLYAEVKFTLLSNNARYIIPTEAVIIRSGDPQVAVLDQKNVVELRTVKIGHDMGSKMEILDGLKEGDIIVINPTDKIKTGVKVKILQAASQQSK